MTPLIQPKIPFCLSLDIPYNQTSEDVCTVRASKYGLLQLYISGNVLPFNSTELSLTKGGLFCSNNTASTTHFNQAKEFSKQLHVFKDYPHSNLFKVNNTCTNADSANSLRLFAFGKQLKKSKFFEPFLYRRFTTTAINATKNDGSPTLGMSLTHVNSEGKANMVDVGEKVDNFRYSVAKATVKLGELAFKLVKENKIKKGDVINVAKLAGIMAAKQTATLIPLCHNIPLSSVKIDVDLDEATYSLVIEGKVKCFGKTGVEMEALTCVSVAALTVYDMCKAASKDIIITNVQLMEKDGGKSGYFRRNPTNE